MPTSSMIVPNCPTGLIFHREDFLHDGFTVDGFLAKYGESNFEMLRDELGMYLQVLRVAMIELINDDYADFVNLSSNLVGIEDKIQAIENPLQDFKSQILDFQVHLNSIKVQLEDKLAKRQSLHEQRVALRNLEHIIVTLNKVERLLKLNDNAGDDQGESLEITGDLVERVASDVNYLNHCLAKCESAPFVQEITPRINFIGDRLHSALAMQLMDALQDNNADVLKRCLRIYTTIDKVDQAEQLIRTKIITPYLEEVLSSASYHSDPLGLQGLCQKVLKIIPEKLALLLKLQKKQNFDFVSKSLWPEVVDKLEQNLSFIFSAGNPDQFHKNYTVMITFLKDLQDHVEAGTNPEQFTSFMQQRWNLSVYFQIRFQEIGGEVEEACQDLLVKSSIGNYNLQATEVVLEGLKKCWRNDIFLQPLTSKFWKLTLQIFARYVKAVEIHSAEDFLANLKKKNKEIKGLQPSPSTPDFRAKGHFRTASDTRLSEQNPVNSEEFLAYTEEELNQGLILVYLDMDKLLNQDFLELLLPSTLPLTESARDLFEKSLAETKSGFEDKLTTLEKIITDRVAKQSCGFLSQVSDIPRLYRRTNREIPSKPCSYLVSLLDPIQTFATQNQDNPFLSKWLSLIFAQVSLQFLAQVRDILESVQKMEESLKRLRRVRDKTTGNSKSQDDPKADKVTDDDKIRLQLLFDVQSYGQAMDKWSVERNPDFIQLETLVQEATNNLL